MDKTIAAAENPEIDWGGSGSDGGRITETVATLSKNVHVGLPRPIADPVKCSLVTGDCLYFHYGCDGQDDRGWGCGYRTVQTMASWLPLRDQDPDQRRPPPSLPDIQRALVAVGDKPSSFSPSREWIGTFEASVVLDFFYGVPCKLVHVRGGGGELEDVAEEELHRHFETRGSPVMMGGDRDNASKGVLGVCTGGQGSYLLVLDPHYWGGQLEKAELQRQGWVAWRKVSSLDQSSFYNLCLPQTVGKRRTRFQAEGWKLPTQ
ncbi:ufm1-specific protease 1 [Brachionichthys hirsutus]|uniref:ufm1-specific protease 1 n=1 Tax=Brachionichthys hirsutus TaxID=412623 RepID=UPI003604B325